MSATEVSILIADDDADVALALARAVRMLGDHVVHIAYSGTEALELLRSTRVDILLSDIDMPGIDGVALACHARSEALAPVRILLTGNARLETALVAVNSGEVHRYLTKPWTLEVLVETLKEAILRLNELDRRGLADQAAQRMTAACADLAAEYPGLTQIEREDGVYVLPVEELESARDLLADTTLHLLLTTRESDGSRS
jgi:CheY-like chemotaxis protein